MSTNYGSFEITSGTAHEGNRTTDNLDPNASLFHDETKKLMWETDGMEISESVREKIPLVGEPSLVEMETEPARGPDQLDVLRMRESIHPTVVPEFNPPKDSRPDMPSVQVQPQSP